MVETGASWRPQTRGAMKPVDPRVLVFSMDTEEREHLWETCAALDCEVTLATDFAQASAAAGAQPHDIVFVDAGVGERRLGDLMNEAKRVNPAVAIILLATPEQAEADPTLLMMVGYEYVTRPVRTATVSSEVRMRLDQQRVRRVSAALTSTLQFRGLLHVVLDLAAQEVGASAATLLLPQDDGALAMEAGLGFTDPAVEPAPAPGDGSMIEWVFEHREPLILQGGFVDLPLPALRDDQAIASAMLLPLILGPYPVGILCVARAETAAGPFTLRELRALEIIAAQAAAAIHSAQTHRALLEQEKIQQELDMARAVQQQFLPKDFPNVPGVRLDALNLPARHIGGDFYNAFRLGPGRLGVVVGDVSGKGIPGALLMTQCMNDLRRAVEDETEAGAVLACVNDRVSAHTTRGMFVTMLYLVLDLKAGRMELANAGHLPMLHVHADTGASDFVGQAQDPPLGITPRTTFTTVTESLQPGDALLLFTDGLVEAKNPTGEEFGFARLEQFPAAEVTFPRSFVGAVAESVRAFVQTQAQHDDLTLVSIQLHPDGPS